jgi:hypothetical protein
LIVPGNSLGHGLASTRQGGGLARKLCYRSCLSFSNQV